jgi:hypothetical protein
MAEEFTRHDVLFTTFKEALLYIVFVIAVTICNIDTITNFPVLTMRMYRYHRPKNVLDVLHHPSLEGSVFGQRIYNSQRRRN